MRFSRAVLLLPLLLAWLLHAPASEAQITLDGSLRPVVPVPKVGPNYTIGSTLGVRPGNGPNLFHSFSQFNLRTGESATFTGTTGIRNILTRVTGGQSSIDGLLASTIPGANLFLLNPRGVVFGPNASLDVSGAFHVTTANVFRFADGATFGQDEKGSLTPASTLTTAPPVAFGFLGDSPARIAIRGSFLFAPAGFSAIGGDVEITPDGLGGAVSAPGRTLSILSVASPGNVGFNNTTQVPDPNLSGFARLGRVQIARDALLDAGADISLGGTVDTGGRIVIRGRQVLVDGALITVETVRDGAQTGIDVRASEEITVTGVTGRSIIETLASGSGRGGDVMLAAPVVQVDFSSVNTRATGQGAPGNVVVEADRLSVTGGATLGSPSESLGRGAGGSTTITAHESVRVAGRSAAGNESAILSDTRFNRDAGRLSIVTPVLTVEDGGAVRALAQGAGQGGEIAISAGRLSLTGGGQVKSRTAGAGNGGVIAITADSVSAAGRRGTDRSGIVSSSCTLCTGAPGEIRVATRTLALTDGAAIASGSSADQGGSVSIAATDAITVSGGASVSSQAFGRDVGRVELSTASLTMDGGLVSTSTLDRGRAGDLVVTVGTASLSGGARITSSSDQLASGAGGDLILTAQGPVSIRGASAAGSTSGLFSTASSGGTGNAGRIAVSAPSLTLSDGGTISVATTGRGRAGDVTLNVGTLSLTAGGQVTSSTAASGRGGDVTVAAAEQIVVAGRSGAGTPSGLVSTAAGSGDAGLITLSAPRVTLDDRGRISVATSGQGKAGGIDAHVGTLVIAGGARIDSGTTGAGEGGTTTVAASDAVTISGRAADGVRSGIFSNAESTGAAGQVSVSTPSLTMVDATIGAGTFGAGKAGNVVIDVARLTMTEGAQMDSTTFGAGAGGVVKIAAAESVLISGSGAGMRSSALGTGAAGQITITSPVLTMVDGAALAAETQGQGAAGNILLDVGSLALTGSSVTSSTSAGGPGGTVTVIGGGLVTLTGSRLASNTTSASRGGDIDVSAAQIRLDDGSQVTATGSGVGDAGNIRIAAANSLVSQDGAITTNSASGTGGNVTVLAGTMLRLIESSVTATALGGDGRGGNIAIGAPTTVIEGAAAVLAPTEFVILERSQIRADAFGGPGGNVQITARVLLQADSAISASSALGLPGTVDVNAQFTEISGSLARLPDAIRQAAALLREACGARVADGRTSSLAVAGRDGVPPEPGGSMPGPLGSATTASLATSAGAAAAARSALDGTPDHAMRAPRLTLRCFK